MKPKTTITVLTYALLALAGAGAVTLPDALPASHAVTPTEADTIRITGVIRDFRIAHSDFAKSLAQCNGHVAGNVLYQLGADDVPVFAEPSTAVTDFDLNGGQVVPDEPYAVEVTVLGSAIDTGSYWQPTTIAVDVDGQRFEPFGGLDQPVDANLSDRPEETGSVLAGSNPRKATLPMTFDAGAAVSVIGMSWVKVNNGNSGLSNSHWKENYSADTSSSNPRYFALRDGDPIPDLAGFENQTSIAEYVSDYVDVDAGTMSLGPNQVIYLFELGTSNLNSSAADYQDIVVLISLASSPGYFQSHGSSGSNTALKPNGFNVSNAWTDADNNPIAPHLYMVGDGGGGPNVIHVTEPGEEPSHGTFDTWNSDEGAYSSSNAGPKPIYSVVASVDAPDVPAALLALPSQGDVQYKNNTTLSSDRRFEDLTIKKTLAITGHVSVLCEGELHLATNAEITIGSNSSLTMYLMNGGSSWNHVEINANTGKPDRVTIYNLGTDELMIHNHAAVYATIISPDAPLHMANHGTLYGRFAGKTVDFDNHGNLHFDLAGFTALDACGNALDDEAGTAGSYTTGCITSLDTFDQWFKSIPNANLSTYHRITLVNIGDGVYEYTTTSFHPIDDQLFGNEGEAHNYNLTYAFEATFTYDQCAGQFFEFQGSDDVWVFVGPTLTLDLGGVVPGTRQYVSMDRLGLTDGEEHVLRFFYAQRQNQYADFSIRTNIYLLTEDVMPTVSAGFD